MIKFKIKMHFLIKIVCFIFICFFSPSIYGQVKEIEKKKKLKTAIWNSKKNRDLSSTLKTKIYFSSKYVKQGEFIYIDIKSDHDILHCIGFVGKKKINFSRYSNLNHFRGFLSFSIGHFVGIKNIIFTVFFKNGKIKTLKKKIRIKRNIIRYVPIVKYKRIKVLKKYKYKGRIKRKWVIRRKRIVRYIKPPIQNFPGILKDNDVHATIQDQMENITNIQQSIIDLGIGEDDYNNEEKSIIDLSKENEIYLKKIEDTRYNSIEEILRDQNNKRIRKINSLEDIKKEFEKEIVSKKVSELYNDWDPIDYTQGPFIFPLKANEGRKRISSPFGVYRRFRYRRILVKRYHRGLDIAAKRGTFVYATNSGKVVLSKRLRKAGLSIIISHGRGIYSSYFHLDKINVEKNFFVNKEQIIGVVGNTGFSTGPHLHWQIMINGVSINTLKLRNYFLKQYVKGQ